MLFDIGKRCWRCKEVKDRSEFYRGQYCCKACSCSAGKSYRQKNAKMVQDKRHAVYLKEKAEGANKARYAKHRDRFLAEAKRYRGTVRGRMKTLVNSAAARARNRGLAFELDIPWAIGLFKEQDGKCLLTGIVLDLSTDRPRGRRFNPFSPSLDRIEADKGYTKDNVRLVCTAVNIALNTFGEEVFRVVCEGFLARCR